MPPHHPLIQEYTWEEMVLEYIADAIEEDRLETGVGGRPVKKVKYKGTEITQTGSKVFDALEKEWADQDIPDGDEQEFLPPEDEDEIPDGTDFLEMIDNQLRESDG